MAPKNNELKNFDLRTVQRNIKLGFINESDYQQHVKSLADETNNFDEIPLEDENDIWDETFDDELDETSDAEPETQV
ncbi:MAG: hypothetical protein ACD_73C00422G0002 [uncultured bacterium]|nr:MAG: hypothetical protein ACD_73C00422G0002 [uncultured bacterium]